MSLAIACSSGFFRGNEVPFSYAERILPHFSNIHNTVVNDPSVLQVVQDECAEYQGMAKEEIPNSIWGRAMVEGDKYRMDVIWGHLKERFPNLPDIALTVLTVTHSNASDERVFSMVKKNQTEFRSHLQLGGSLNSIVRIKMAYPESVCPCHEWMLKDDLLKSCTSATKTYNEEHSSKKYTTLKETF